MGGAVRPERHFNYPKFQTNTLVGIGARVRVVPLSLKLDPWKFVLGADKVNASHVHREKD